jgi:iron(III) transport system ATP-binding protein
LSNLSKSYGRVVAVDGVSLDVGDGELFFLLGPSGCGKTTLLRMIAGFVEPSRGTVMFDDRDVTRLAPNRRGTGMVFQHYALWPHMTVFDNVAYGLGVRRLERAERHARAMEALRLVQMHEFAKRKPGQLSGGQQQRVALARALVIRPRVLLLDEPLSNLDARLRQEMREQIRRLVSETNITAVYVTHDQQEALSMADRIAVMRDGRIEQTGSPREVYRRPVNAFVADFLGETNFLHATIASVEGGAATLDTPAGRLRSTAYDDHSPRSGQALCSIRPEAIRLVDGAMFPPPVGVNTLAGRLRSTTFLGDTARHVVELAGGATVKATELNPRAAQGDRDAVRLAIDPADVVVMPVVPG